jgi:hypothetical protein
MDCMDTLLRGARGRTVLACAGIAGLCLLTIGRIRAGHSGADDIAPLPERRVLRTAGQGGAVYKLTDDGRMYRVAHSGRRWEYVQTVFNPKEIGAAYVKDRGAIYRVDPGSGTRYPVRKEFADDFEQVPTGAAGIRGLIGEAHMWSELTLQSPRASAVADYVALRNGILKGDRDFLDARVEPVREQARGGTQSLRCFCPAKSESMQCSKASLSTGIIYFQKGDDVWYRAWYRVEGSTLPLTLVDLEDSLVSESPGLRVRLFDDGEIGVELKCLDKPTFRQTGKNRILFPTNRWVEVLWHIRLDDGPNGIIQLWQDGKPVVDATGTTLPFRTSFYNSLEVGISAHSNSSQPATLYVDDILLTAKPLRR